MTSAIERILVTSQVNYCETTLLFEQISINQYSINHSINQGYLRIYSYIIVFNGIHIYIIIIMLHIHPQNPHKPETFYESKILIAINTEVLNVFI